MSLSPADATVKPNHVPDFRYPNFAPARRDGYNREMAILLPALGVAFAALCVWIGVRIINHRNIWAIELAIYGIAFLWSAAFLGLGLTGATIIP